MAALHHGSAIASRAFWQQCCELAGNPAQGFFRKDRSETKAYSVTVDHPGQSSAETQITCAVLAGRLYLK
jgi:hypothetical protein